MNEFDRSNGLPKQNKQREEEECDAVLHSGLDWIGIANLYRINSV
jgi:hypothetical protein